MKNIFTIWLNRIKQSEFMKNVATLVTGTAIAQLVSVFTAPILYRIYDKVDYGILGIYMAITSVVGVFSTMQYLQPILLEKDDQDAKKIMWLNRLVNLFVTVLVFLLIVLFGDFISSFFDNKSIVFWLYLIPISIFFTGQNEIYRIWATRKKKYKIISVNAILTALLVPLVSISVGLTVSGPLGLFLGLLTSQIVPPIVLFLTLTKIDDLGFKHLDFNLIKLKAKQYRSFPLYNLPTEFINRFINQLPVFMLGAYAGIGIVGIYNLCVRMLGLPIQLIGGAIGDVFKQNASYRYNLEGGFKTIYIKTLKSLLLISIVPLTVILLFGPHLFAFFFGEKWVESGILAQILIFLFGLRLIVSPLSYAFVIKNRLKEHLYWHIYLLMSMSLIFFIGFKITDNYLSIIKFYTINYCLIYVIYLFRGYKFSKKNNLI